MWGQTTVIFLGVWLVLSPFIFSTNLAESPFLVQDFILGSLTVTLGLISCYYPYRVFSVLIALVATWCVLEGYLGYPHPRPPAAQNHIAIGLLLFMFLIIPLDDKIHAES